MDTPERIWEGIEYDTEDDETIEAVTARTYLLLLIPTPKGLAPILITGVADWARGLNDGQDRIHQWL